MMHFRAFKYISPLIFYITAWVSFTMYGFVCFLPVVYAWVIIPLLELVLPPDYKNLEAAEEEMSRQDIFYDYVLYLFVVIQIVTVFYFLHSMQDARLSGWDRLGRIATMGLLCGIFGINIGHELGHRINKAERNLAKLSLMTSLYMHFFIEHNKGHHKHVATMQDPSSARLGESLYKFWPRSILYSYISAWKIANKEVKCSGKKSLSLHNEMIQAHIIQICFIIVIAALFGGWAMLYFFVAALNGILLLETVNYIEHYGLSRKQIEADKFERVQPYHSWNSNYVFGRIMLFELSRHSDHHYLASRKYQLLRHHENAPQMPTGYPGMMILSLVPIAWFFVMNRRINTMESVNKKAFEETVSAL